MKNIDKDTTSQIIKVKENIPVYEFYSKYLELSKTGKNYTACCPFHNEKTPSFRIDSETGFFKCFGGTCGKSGDIFNFYMFKHEVSFWEALEELASEYGIEIDIPNTYKQEIILKNKLYYLNAKVLKIFRNNLKKNKVALQYLMSKRRLSIETINKFKIGCTFSDDLHKIKNEKVLEYLKVLGLVIENEDGLRDFFRGNRIIIPYIDERNRITGFTSRAINDDNYLKYLNSKESIIFKKSEALFGYNFSKKEILNRKSVIIYEGHFDCIRSIENDIENCIAVGSLALSELQIKKLGKIAKSFYLCFDNDKAGQESIEKTVKNIREILPFVSIYIIEIPKGDKDKIDADEYLIYNSNIEFKKLIKNAQSYNLYAINKIIGQGIRYKTIEDKKKYIYLLRNHLNSLNSIDKGQYIELLSNKLNIPEGDIYFILKGKKQSFIDMPEVGECDIKQDSMKNLVAVLLSEHSRIKITELMENYCVIEYLSQTFKSLYKFFNQFELTPENKQDIINNIYSNIKSEKVRAIINEIIFLVEEIDLLEEEELELFIQEQIEVLK